MNALVSGEEATTVMHPPGLPLPGAVIADKYVVERVIGVGGMAVVLAARHVHLDQRVAIKLLLAEHARHSETVTRFLREGQAAARIRSEHVVRVHDVGVNGSQGPYMVLELLEGMDLGERVAAGMLPIPLAVDYVLEACEAIAEAHALGIVHRDLKPSNLFLSRRPDGTDSIKVLDFGISKVTPKGEGAAELKLTATGGLLGTPTYMAPEQMRGLREVDARADIWGVGSVLYELCAGGPPFTGENMAQLAAAVMSDPAPRLRFLRADAPQQLDAVIERCLQKRPEDRYPNLLEMAHALAPLGTPAAQGSVERIARALQSGPGQSGSLLDPSMSLAATTRPPATPARRSVGRTVLAAGAVAMVVGGLGAFVYLRGSVAVAPRPPESATGAPSPVDTVVAPRPEPAATMAPAPIPPAPTAQPSSLPSISASAAAPALRSPLPTASPRPAASSVRRPFIATDREK